MSEEDIIKKFCNKLKQLNLDDAAKIVEDVAKELVNMKVTPSSLERLNELIKQEISDEVDLAKVRSEIFSLNIPLSTCFADALKNIGLRGKELTKLRKLLDALINFYKYYSSAKTE